MKQKDGKSLYFRWLNWKISGKVTSSIVLVTLFCLSVLMLVNYINNVMQMTEQIGDELVTLGDQAILRAVDQVDSGVKILETLAKTPSLVSAVAESNQLRADWTTEKITGMDKSWISKDPSMEKTVSEIENNGLSEYLVNFINDNPAEVEVFVTDLKGLNLAMTDRTSDFLQSDEEWWKSTFSNGSGDIYIGEVEYDESSQIYAMNIGVPVLDSNTQKVIGVLRGTLDISILVQSLGNVKIGEAGSITLLDRNGVILYSHNPDLIMQPAP